MDMKFGLLKRKHEWPRNPWKDPQYHLSSGKCKLRSPWNTTFTPTGIANGKRTDNTKWRWGCRATGTLILMETQNDTITLKNNLAASYKFKHSFFIRSSSSTPGYLPKRMKTCLHNDLHVFTAASHIIAPDWTPHFQTKFSSTGEWINQL